MAVQFFALSIVMPTLNRKTSAPMTTTKSSAIGISRSGRPCVHPKRNPTMAVTPVATRAISWNQARPVE